MSSQSAGTATNPTSPGTQRAREDAIDVGATITARELVTISGARVDVPRPDRLVHLQFRRFAGCPVCNLHLRSVVRRHEEIKAASIDEVVVFHSSQEDLLKYESELPFDVIADPKKRLYVEFGAEAHPKALLSPRAWRPLIRAVKASATTLIKQRKGPVPPLFPKGGRTGLPADFLIASDGRVLARKYGEHVDDQWSVDELLAHASAHGGRS